MADAIPVTRARAELSELVGRVAFGGERIPLTRHGRIRAALVPAEDLARLEALDAGEFVGAEFVSAVMRHDTGVQLAPAAEHRQPQPGTPFSPQM